jgi:hypothetical protein
MFRNMRDNTNTKIHAELLAGFVKLTTDSECRFIDCRRGGLYDIDILDICT